jgi:heptosyltransferase-3
LRKVKKILVIIQRSNGDVFLSSSLLNYLNQEYTNCKIDLLVNDDTLPIAKVLPYIHRIHTFSYKDKKNNRWGQEFKIILNVFRKYDLSINLTSSDRSVIYALLSGKKTISAVEFQNTKSWWKKLLLSKYYYFDNSSHILINNLKPLKCLNIKTENILYEINVSNNSLSSIKKKLDRLNINEFFIFHASTQYMYKVYPENLRTSLLKKLDKLGVPIIVTGGKSKIDLNIKKELPSLTNLYDFIGQTSLEDFMVLSKFSIGYIGMDTLNMHIAASQNKRIFAIFGPTNLKMWSPWSNTLKESASIDAPIQDYANITIFQADMPCVACGKAGCDDNGISLCLEQINPKVIFDSVKEWYESR